MVEEVSFGANPGNLKMFIHSPNGIDSQVKRPLVIALHGCSQDSKNISVESGWNKLADDNNFIVLYPEQKRSNNMSKCFNWFELDDIAKNAGELQSIINMVDYGIQKYNIDTSQIFVYGLSAGAAMGVSLLAVYPSYFKVGAIFAGAPYKIATNKMQAMNAMIKTKDKTPLEWGSLVSKDTVQQEYPKLIVFHGTKDKVVSIDNSIELIDQWTYLHHIDTTPDNVTTSFKTSDVERIVYSDSLEEEKIVFYRISNLGHAIPIDPGKEEWQGGKSGMFTKKINFFSTYYVAKEFGLIKQ